MALYKYIITTLPLLLACFLALGQQREGHFPYAKAGLNRQQAAAHLLSRFAYGPREAEVKAVSERGLERWFEEQLAASASDQRLAGRLELYTSARMSTSEIVDRFQKPREIEAMAKRDNAIPEGASPDDKEKYRSILQAYARQKGFLFEKELVREFVSQKILRSVYSENQLHEVMTEFWLNHFNVSFTNRMSVKFIPNYERDVIRPNALGNFETLLVATTKSPAMLTYLDNFRSVADDSGKNPNRKKKGGINENYARELMELHTLGVDGGYSQKDVTEVARILTGWTVMINSRQKGQNPLQKPGEFFFATGRHDKGAKVVMGKTFPAGGGMDEGLALLKMLAGHPSTAAFIARKIAIRFVSDNPPATLVDKMKKTFLEANGDIKAVLTTMVTSDEFWNKEAVREKIKSPFELAISAIRLTNSEVTDPYKVFSYINRMGQRIYHFPTPTGFPDQAKFWINTGALLARMNFGVHFAKGAIPGIKVNLLALNENHEPESSEEALRTYCGILLPERDLAPTLARLTPLADDPGIGKKINAAARKEPVKNTTRDLMREMSDEEDDADPADDLLVNEKNMDYRLADIVGIIIGSPEFQRR